MAAISTVSNEAAITRGAGFCTLDQLGKGQSARILAIEPNARFGTLDPLITLRLKELGFMPGAQLTVVGFGLFGRDPVAVRIGSTKFALRRAEASKILIQPNDGTLKA